MSEPQVELESLGEGRWEATTASLDGQSSVTLRIIDIEALSDGALSADEATARAMMLFLLEHQDAADLPRQVDGEQVLAAYEDAVEGIRAHLRPADEG